MKICMLTTIYPRYEYEPRGVMIVDFNRLLQELGHEVHVVVPADISAEDESVYKGVYVHRFSYFFPKRWQRLTYSHGIPTNIRRSFLARLQVPFFAIAFFLKALKHSKKCDIIHCQWLLTGAIGALVKKLVKKPVVITVRRIPRGNLMVNFAKYAIKNSDIILFNSSYTQKECLKIAKPRWSMVLHNSLDTKTFHPLSNKIKDSFRKEINIPKDAFVLLYVGQLIEKKGPRYLINAMPQIVKKFPNTYLIVIGFGTEEKYLKKMTKKFDLEKNIIFAGELKSNTMPSYFNIADVFVCPSIVDSKGETETLGVILMEALACEIPVVCSKVGGTSDIVTKDVGILVKQKSPKQIASAVSKLLKNKSLRNKMGKLGRKRISAKFSEASVKKKINKIYKKLYASQK